MNGLNFLEQKYELGFKEAQEAVAQIEQESRNIQTLDPLNVDLLLQHKETMAIHQFENAVEECTAIFPGKKSRTDSLAVLRDLGFALGYIKRFNPDYVISPAIEALLQSCSEVSGEVPRDTVYSYSIRNPTGERQRLFTTNPQEIIFVDSLYNGILGLHKAVIALFKAYTVPDEMINQCIDDAVEGYSEMVDSMVAVSRHVDPQWFTHELRPFFQPLLISGIEYAPPNGAQMPNFIIDMFLFNSSNDQALNAYWSEEIKYLPVHLKNLIPRVSDQGTKAEVLDSLERLINKVISFRAVHSKVAKKNFALREVNAKGGGGYDLEMLDQLTQHTYSARNNFRK